MTACEPGACITNQDCHDPRCRYPEPHKHSFACDKTCACLGRGYGVDDPENHPNHRQWKAQCTCRSVGVGCPRHHRKDDL